jgi:hypothetical protein
MVAFCAFVGVILVNIEACEQDGARKATNRSIFAPFSPIYISLPLTRRHYLRGLLDSVRLIIHALVRK